MKKTILLALLVLLGVGFANAQTRVTGTVTGADDGKPLPFVTVTVKGTTVVATTNASGKYSINVPSGNATLVFSFSGMKTQEIAVGERSVIDAVLEFAVEQLEAATVTAMGIQRSDKSMGYSVSKVETDEVLMKAEPDPLRALSGKIPGVQINSSSSSAGSATRMVVRGNSSFLSNNQPLFVVDGVPYSNEQVNTTNQLTGASGAYGTGISTLDPNDIESMSVLKGAAAAALYGSRAANGVVLITTKSGSKRKRPSQKGFEVSVAGSYAWEEVTSLPDYQNTFGAGSSFNATPANGSWGAPFSEVTEIPTWSGYRAAYPDLFGATVPYKAYPNNVKDLFDVGSLYDFSTTVSSNNDKGNFTATGSRMKQDGFIPYSEFERYSFSAGGNQRLDNGFRVGANASYSKTIQQGPIFGASNYAGAASSFARTLLLARNWDMSTPYEKPDGSSLFMVAEDNPLWSWKHNKITTESERSLANMSLGVNITSWLAADYQIGVNVYNMDRKQIIDIGSKGAGGLGSITNTNYKREEIESNFLLTATKKLGKDLTLKAVVGQNFNIRKGSSQQAVGTEIMSPGVFNIDNTKQQTFVASNTYPYNGESHTERRLWALFADASLSYKDYLFLNVTGRNDFSSTLPEKNNSYFYPAVATSFVFTDAIKAIQNNVLTYGKLRAGWGMVGNDASPYYVNGYYVLDGSYNGQPMLSLSTLYFDEDLSPEFTKEWEFGTELQFFNNRAGIDFTWYSRATTDQIAPVAMAASSGKSSFYTNFGKLTNKGVEIGLSLVPIQLKNSFKWDIYATYSKNKSRVVSLIDGVERIPLPTGSSAEVEPTLEPGQPYGVFRGTYILRDTDGTPLVDPTTGAYMEAPDKKILGDPNPDWRANVSNTFSFKGISLGATFDCVYGGDMVAGTASMLMGRGVTKDTENRYGTRVLPGVMGDASGPILDASGNRIPNYVQLSEFDLWFSPAGMTTFSINSVHEFEIYDATVFRLSEVTLGWDIPKKWLSKLSIGSASISLVGRNLWFFAPNFPEHTNYDPGANNTFGATNIQGIERDGGPSVRRYSVNLKLTF